MIELLDQMTPLEGAVCAETDPEIWFPEKGKQDFHRRAVKLCQSCPYLIACREYAIPRINLMGIWGGTTERGRRRIRQQRGITEPKPIVAKRGRVTGECTVCGQVKRLPYAGRCDACYARDYYYRVRKQRREETAA